MKFCFVFVLNCLFIYSSQLIRFTRTRSHQPKPKLLNARPKLIFISQFENFSFFQENVKNLKCKWFVEKIQCVIVKCLVRKDKINAISEANQFLVRFFSWKRKISLQNLKHWFCFLAFFREFIVILFSFENIRETAWFDIVKPKLYLYSCTRILPEKKKVNVFSSIQRFC